jgi:hypothetical protein
MSAHTNFGFRYHTVSPKNPSIILFLLLISQFIAKNALARPDIFFGAIVAEINVASCQSCHESEPGGEGKESLKPGYETAYNLDMNDLSRLKNLINGCPTGQTLNRTTFVCATSVPVPVVCTLPQVRDPATNTCITPPCPTGQVRNSVGVCEVPPVVCTLPQVRDPATNTCITPPCPTGQVRNSVGVCEVPPVVCTLPQVRDPATNTCITPPCPTGQVINSTGVCEVPPVVCTLPQVRDPVTNTCITPPCPNGQVRNLGGVCETPPSTAGCDATRQNTPDLKISDPGYIFTHAGRVTRAGVTVFGDNRRVEMAVSGLPRGARFYDAYNPSLRSVEGVIVWQVPVAMAGQKLEFNLCGTSKGGGKPEGYVNRKITIEVLPPLANATVPDPTVSTNYLISSVYNNQTGKLEVSGQVIWFWKTTEAARQSAILQPVELSDAETGNRLGSGEVGLNGRWFISVPVARNNLPKAVDATFLGRLGTKPVQNFDDSDEDN